jgi:DNA gyrase subunit A
MGRAAQGVRLINLKNNTGIAAIARVPRSEEEDETELEGTDLPEGNTENSASGTDIDNGSDE